ncbi:MAG: aminotransferase class I/II-fold pyridoxal phosphate-dependent enzyme, partial [Spirochaetales bacterium]
KAIVMLNFPNNPTGYSPTVQEAQILVRELKTLADHGFRLLVVSDDAYFGLFFEKETYTCSLFRDLCSIHPNIVAVKVDGPTKEDFVWGFRVGFLTFGSPELSQAQFEALNKKLMVSLLSSISNPSKPAQSIIKKALKDPAHQVHKDRYFAILKDRYLKVKEICANRTKGRALKALPFNSGYFMSFRFEGGDAEKLRLELLMNEGIGTISIQDSFLRIAFASIDVENLEALYNAIFDKADKLTS